MRIATTASPVSGSDVRHKMIELAEDTAKRFCAGVLKTNYLRKRMRRDSKEGLDSQIAQLRRLQDERNKGIFNGIFNGSVAAEEERKELKDTMAMDTVPLKGRSPSLRGVRGDGANGADGLSA